MAEGDALTLARPHAPVPVVVLHGLDGTPPVYVVDGGGVQSKTGRLRVVVLHGLDSTHPVHVVDGGGVQSKTGRLPPCSWRQQTVPPLPSPLS